MTKSLLSLSILILLCSYSCEKENSFNLSNEVDLTESIRLSLPENFALEPAEGGDSVSGRIVNPNDSTFILIYDIGTLAGEYVDPDSPTKKKGKASQIDFWYDKVDKKYINSDDCCIFYTFPSQDPANFVGLNNEHADLVQEIVKSFERL